MTTTETRDLQDDSLTGLLARAGECEAILREVAVHQLAVAYEWAIAHPVLDAAEGASGPVLPEVLTRPELLGGDGTRRWRPSPPNPSPWPAASHPPRRLR